MQFPLKRVLFRLHWISGLVAGLVLSVVGVTGALLGVEAELMHALNPALAIKPKERGAPKPLSAAIEAAVAAHTGYRARGVAWDGDDAAIVVRIARAGERNGPEVAVDPHSGVAIGELRGADFFATVEQLHRNLAAGPVGKEIVGASTALLVLMAITGIVLRWPRRAASARAWFAFNPKLRGRALLWNLHSVGATWLLLPYLIVSLTGLWWSYDVYRDAINRAAGVTMPARRAPPDARGEIPLAAIDLAWATFRREQGDASRATLSLAGDAGAPIEIRYQAPASPHSRAWNTLKVDGQSGAVVARELYAELPTGRRLVSSIFPLHSGDFFGRPGRIAMALAALLMPFFFVTGIWMWIRRRAAAKRPRAGSCGADDAIAAAARARRGLSPIPPMAGCERKRY
jgi:sulfite reductase (NADPH) flavoprotein alpha-component